MTAKLPKDRRQLAAHDDQADAQASVLGEQGWLLKADGIEVVYSPRWPGDEQPWAVTAARTTRGNHDRRPDAHHR